MRRVVPMPLLFAALMVGCSSASEKKVAAPPPPPPVKDDTALLLPLNRTAARIVPDHLLGMTAMPGGTIGDYEEGGKKYQLFIIETASAQDAAILLLDLKVSLTDPAYIAYMGGYFGTDAGKPVYVFAKLKYLAGVVGLPKNLADPVARQLAARLY
ncbi:MAG: hypothetical protein ABSG41_12285 [Bryobacteraceae bacterium]|jgi:hypothetical protein